MPNLVRKAVKLFDRQGPLLVLLSILLLLRFPNLFEPYWYTDEGIYLTVGQGIKHGRRLYTGIFDHKTPIIYYLATVPNQFWFRVLNIGWMTVTTVFFYRLAKKLLADKTWSWVSTLVFVLFTSLPLFEGNIPNGELFAMGFVLAGANLLVDTDHFGWLTTATEVSVEQRPLLFSSGVLFGLGILTKVPALLDFAAFLAIGWFHFTHRVFSRERRLRSSLRLVLSRSLWLGLGVSTPIVLSIIYFVAIGSGQDYLQYGLLYNLHYTSSWQTNIDPEWLTGFFDLRIKLVLLSAFFASLTVASRVLTHRSKFLFGWLALALFGVTLSGRPYAHYYQQVAPASCLLVGYIGQRVASHRVNRLELQDATERLLFVLMMGLIITLALVSDLHSYPAFAYYQDFWHYITGRNDRQDYYQRFNPAMKDTYEVAEYIRSHGEKEVFIWGDNPMLYALSKSIPVGRFTVSFHIKDIGAYASTMTRIEQVEPNIIVVMNDETGQFDGFYQYLHHNYHLEKEYECMRLYLRDTFESEN